MNTQKPLAEILRPEALEGYIGQEHLLGEGAILQRSIRSGNLPSMILWGPPGVGKTTLAYIISQSLHRPFYTLSAVNSGVKEVRAVIEKAKDEPGAILFIDEIHRFSKSQQDSLLGAVETGIITLIGATTENPSLEVISPLLSRCQVYILKSLEEKHLRKMLENARLNLSQSLDREIFIDEDEALIRVSGGDARKLFNAIELVVKAMLGEAEIRINNRKVLDTIQQNIVMYDKGGEQHYDVISAFIKSIRGSDPNAAVYWLARMIAGGEDPKFIARRLVILASEDIGNANPNALLLANACFDAINKIGWPEGRIILSQTAVYLATSPKSNASYMAIDQALALVEKTGDLSVPLHLRNAPTKFMKNIGYGKEYKYAHAYEDNFVLQDFLPDKIANTLLYDPGKNAREEEVRKWLHARWKGKYGY
jgi:putative ATPase